MLEDKGNKYKGLCRLLLKAAGVTMLALVFSLFLSNPFTATVSGMFSSPERGDFRMTDLYAQVADSRPVRSLEDRVVMVDIGLAGREELSDCFEVISLADPKAVGIDINFAEPMGDGDRRLIESLRALPGGVLPLGLEQKGDGSFGIAEKPFFYDSVRDMSYGAVNLVAAREGASIREYALSFPSVQGEIPSFVGELARNGGDGAKVDSLKRVYGPGVVTDYASRELEVIPICDVLERAGEFTGRYVIVGSLNEAGDMHSTPIDSYMSGMMIHSYGLSSLLDGKARGVMPRWVDYALGTLLCFVLVALAVSQTSKLRGLVLRIFQSVCLVGAVLTGYFLYIDKDIECDFSHTVLMLAFGLFALDVWNGGEWALSKLVPAIRKIKRRRCKPSY